MRSPISYLPVASGFLVLILSLAVGVLTVSNRQVFNTKAAQDQAVLSLSPTSGTYAFTPGTTYPVGIVVNSGGKNVDGIDVIVNYDPAKVRVMDANLSTANLFEENPVNTIDNVRGQIKYSGLTFKTKPVAGIVGTFRYQPLTKGEVNFTFYFSPGSTTDSNVAENATAQDILTKVENARYTFN